MPWLDVIWTDIALEKIAANHVTEDEVEEVVLSAIAEGRSRSTGRPTYTGFTSAGRRIFVVFRRLDSMTIEIITAYEPERD